MMGTGGSALVAKTLGEQDPKRANRYFTMMVVVTLIAGLLLSLFGILFIRPISYFLGATEAMIEDCVLYGRTLLIFNTAFMLQNVFQSFFVAAQKPKLGLIVTVAAGLANMVLDALFIAVFHWGLAGAALATGLSQCVGGVLPLIYFLRPNSSLLQLKKTRLEASPVSKACINGSSELMTNISSSLVSMLYNFQLIRFAGENGVAAYGVVMYVQFIFMAVFIGYTIGTGPIVSYHYGAGNEKELKNMLRKSLFLTVLAGIFMLALGYLLAPALSDIFVGYDQALYETTARALQIFAVSFVLSGINIFASAFFTALNNGIISASISFLRTLVFQVLAILLLPLFWGIDGIWLSVAVAEVFACLVSAFFLILKKKEYHYF